MMLYERMFQAMARYINTINEGKTINLNPMFRVAKTTGIQNGEPPRDCQSYDKEDQL